MRTLTIELEDHLYDVVKEMAEQNGTTPEVLGGECIARAVSQVENDPLLALAGTLESDVTDVAERHDHYLGQALYAELRGQT